MIIWVHPRSCLYRNTNRRCLCRQLQMSRSSASKARQGDAEASKGTHASNIDSARDALDSELFTGRDGQSELPTTLQHTITSAHMLHNLTNVVYVELKLPPQPPSSFQGLQPTPRIDSTRSCSSSGTGRPLASCPLHPPVSLSACTALTCMCPDPSQARRPRPSLASTLHFPT